jgi:hypothetical protein
MSVTHRCPPQGSNIMPCCGKTPFEVSKTDRMSLDDSLVTCNVLLDRFDNVDAALVAENIPVETRQRIINRLAFGGPIR